MQTALTLLAAYLLGSIPFAMVAAKVFGLADPRTFGSGNPGATNVLRTGNKKAALFTLVGDGLKGWLAVFLAQQAGLSALLVSAVALAVFLGHLFPIFLKFKGGKGVATAAGVLIALNPWLGLATLATWLLVAYVTRYSSLAAILAALMAPVYTVLLLGQEGPVVVVLIIALALVAKHWGNIQRLMAGQESRIGQKKQAKAGVD